MEIKPQKDYKKPIYAVGLASLIAVTGAVSGCSNATLEYDGDISLMGAIAIESSVPETEENSVSAETNIPPLTLEGDIALPSDSIDE
ncbi:MAG: hypothetical protein IKT78_01425 [Ruminiclostridium sp.]|nr:hypothetical protein [Ruminiclostridium sp.]